MNRRICGSFLFEKKVWAVEALKTVILRKNSDSANSAVKDKANSKKPTNGVGVTARRMEYIM